VNMDWILILCTVLFFGGIIYVAVQAFLFALWLLKKILPALILLSILWIIIILI